MLPIALSLMASSIEASWGFVRITAAATGASTNPNVVALPSGTTLHNVLVATFAYNDTSSASSVSGRCNATWTLLKASVSGGLNAELWYCLDAVAGAGNVSLSITGGTATFLDGYVAEYTFTSGATLSVDGTAAATNGNSGSAATGTVTTTGTDDLILAAATTPSTSSVNNSFNLRSTADGNGVADRIVSSATGYTCTFTTTSGFWVAVIGALKAVGGGGGTPIHAKPAIVF